MAVFSKTEERGQRGNMQIGLCCDGCRPGFAPWKGRLFLTVCKERKFRQRNKNKIGAELGSLANQPRARSGDPVCWFAMCLFRNSLSQLESRGAIDS